MKTLAKNTIILASPKIFIFFIGIVKAKVIAIFLGPTGFGIIEQLTSTINFIRQSTLSFMPDGMVKLVARERSESFDKKVIGDIVKTYFLMVIPLTILIFVLALIFSNEITLFVLGDLKYKPYYLFAIFALPVSFIGVSLGSLLKAFKEIRTFAFRDIINAVLSFLFFVPLIYFFKIQGGVIHITVSIVSSLIVTFLLVRKNVFIKYDISFDYIKHGIFSTKYFKELLAFIGVGMIAGSFRVFESMASRAIVVNQLGIESIGIYSPITKWQALFIGFILPSVYTYLYPRLSEIKDNKDITGIINDVFRMITFLTLPFILLGISMRQWIVPMFYSKEFIEATIYLPYHFSFLLFAVWATIFEQIFAPIGRLKIFLIFTVVIYSISLLLVYYFVPKFGLYGYMLKFTVTPFFATLIFFIYWRREISFKVRKENLSILVYSLICCISLLFLKEYNYFIQFIMAVLLIIGLVFFLTIKEKKFVLKKIRSVFKS